MPSPRYPKRLKLALTPTPLQFMPRLTAELGGPQIWFKRDDLTGATLSGNKIRKLEFSLAEALKLRADVVITAGGTQSNHCRATALCCAQLGLECHLVLRGEPEVPADGNLLLDHLAGARCSFYPREVYSSRRLEIVAELTEKYAAQGKKAYWIPLGASNAVGSWGYIRAYQELMEQAARATVKIDHVVSAVGSGGTLTGLIAGKALLGDKRPQIWGVNVCDDAAYFQNEIRGILDELKENYGLGLKEKNTPIQIIDGYVGEGYAIPYAEEVESVRMAAAIEGQVLDPVYTGKAFWGLREEIRKGRFGKKDRVVFLHTGGVFGLFPTRQLFA